MSVLLPNCVECRGRQASSTVKHYQSDDSIFVDDAYLIKGIAGRILWKLLRIYDSEQRVHFTNRGRRPFRRRQAAKRPPTARGGCPRQVSSNQRDFTPQFIHTVRLSTPGQLLI